MSISLKRGQSSIFFVIKTVGEKKEKVSEGQQALVPHFVKMNVYSSTVWEIKKIRLEDMVWGQDDTAFFCLSGHSWGTWSKCLKYWNIMNDKINDDWHMSKKKWTNVGGYV